MTSLCLPFPRAIGKFTLPTLASGRKCGLRTQAKAELSLALKTHLKVTELFTATEAKSINRRRVVDGLELKYCRADPIIDYRCAGSPSQRQDHQSPRLLNRR